MSVSYQVSRGAGSLVKQIASNSNLISPLLSSKDNQNRNLQAFSTLNSIFSEVTLVLPDSSLSSNGLDLTISELTCSDLSVQDIQLGHNSLSDTTKRIFINISGLEITCNYRWSYKWTIFSGSGFGVALLDPSSFASINFDFVSEDFEQYPPKDVNIDDCKSEVQIGDLNFDGDGLGFISSILNLFEGMLRDRIEGEVDMAVCTELKGLGEFNLSAGVATLLTICVPDLWSCSVISKVMVHSMIFWSNSRTTLMLILISCQRTPRTHFP
jgi:hypothetical protein